MLTRRLLLGLAPMLPLVAAPALAQDAVSLRLNWYLGGLRVPFYSGVDRGYYKAEGIELQINEGRGSANTVQVVAAGSDTFGLADSSSLVSLIAIFFFQAEDGIRDKLVTGVQTCALPISVSSSNVTSLWLSMWNRSIRSAAN